MSTVETIRPCPSCNTSLALLESRKVLGIRFDYYESCGTCGTVACFNEGNAALEVLVPGRLADDSHLLMRRAMRGVEASQQRVARSREALHDAGGRLLDSELRKSPQ